jgi:TonB-dependent SusC/RagA subfamily outer membrane receptor
MLFWGSFLILFLDFLVLTAASSDYNPNHIVLSLTIMKRIVSIVLLTAMCSLAASGQGDNPGQALVKKLTSWVLMHPAEKAYLQFDKPVYAAGDTIYFKAYITKGDAHKLSNISGVVHVDLVNTSGKIDQSIKLRLDTGLAWDDFALPDSLPQGNYTVRAYTQWMRNSGETGFFEKIIPVGSIKPPGRVSPPRRPAQNPAPDIQFFPEGGNLVTGVSCKIAFKAVGPNGFGIEVKGAVSDNDGKKVASFASSHLGMGFFWLTPAMGKTYTASLTFSDGSLNQAKLPESIPGIALSVDNSNIATASVAITAGVDYYSQNKGKNYTLLIYSGGLINAITCRLDSSLIKLDIIKRRLRTGIASVTLFSADNEALCERRFFVQNYDQLNINVAGDKPVYAPRGETAINMKALNRLGGPSAGHFSVSVINETRVPTVATESNILSELLLAPGLKGYVEQPGYYFSDTTAAVREDIDLLMLTQGYSHFEWQTVIATSSQPLAYQPEAGILIAGRVTNYFNKPVNTGVINLFQFKSNLMLTSPVDSAGMFRFSNLIFTDTAHFVLNAINKKGKNNVDIHWFDEDKDRPAIHKWGAVWQPVADTTLTAYASNEKMEQREILSYLNGKSIMLKPVNIHTRKPDNQYYTQSLAGAGNADQVMHADQISQVQGQLDMSLNGRLFGIVFRPSVGRGPVRMVPYLTGGLATGPMLVIVDGVEGVEINTLLSSEVETVEVLKYASAAIYGMQGANGVLIVTTKRGAGDGSNVPAKGVLPINPIGFYRARVFYSPKYDVPDAVKQPDLRSTIYWQPELKTNDEGEATFSYYNADGTGTYKVTIEGIDKDGNIGRQVFRYEVR